MRIGWLSTGRDQAACNLLSDVVARAQQDDVPLDIGAVFCDRERGEAPESDRFLDLVDRLGIPAVTLSSRASWAEAQKLGVSRTAWRDEYHRGVAELLIPYRLGVLVLAGYMLIASPALCRKYAMLNLHPALPGGPKGMWQQVIWELLEDEADETGAMIHLATAQLDRGPVVSAFRFSLRGPDWDPLWRQFRAKRKTMSVAEIAAAEGEDEPLFAEIRRRGEVREDPAALPHHPAVRGGQAEHGERLRLRRVHPAAARPHRGGRGRGGEGMSAGAALRPAPGALPPPAASTSPTAKARSPATTTPRRSRSGSSRTGPSSSPASAATTTSWSTSPQAGLQRRRHAAPRPAVLQAYHVSDEDVETFSAEQVLLVPRALKTLDAVSALMPAFIISTSYTPYLGAVRARRVPVRARALHRAQPGRLGDAGGRGGLAPRASAARVRAIIDYGAGSEVAGATPPDGARLRRRLSADEPGEAPTPLEG